MMTPSRDPVGRYLSRFALGSHRSVNHALAVIAELLDAPGKDPRCVNWTELSADHCAALRGRLLARYARTTAHRVLLVLRGVLREAAAAGLMDAEVHRSVEGIRRPVRQRTGRVVVGRDLVRLFESCRKDTTIAGCRDAAALALVCGLGLRRSAAVALDRECYLRSGKLVIPQSGGRFARMVALPPRIREALDAWLKLRGEATGPLLCPVNKAGVVQIRRMSDQALYLIIVRRSIRAGVRASPDDLRRPYERRRRQLERNRRRSFLEPAPEDEKSAVVEVPFVGCGPACSVG